MFGYHDSNRCMFDLWSPVDDPNGCAIENRAFSPYAKHEQETFTQVVDARAKALGTSDNIEEYAEAQQQVTAALGRLIAISENYPELKADANFLELQAQLEGTENRITVARGEYNEQVKKFNTATVTFPSNLIAGMFGFEKKALFTASEGAAQAPQVKFW